MKYGNLREEYKKDALLESNLMESPFDMFEFWFEEAKKINPADANAMVLSTLNKEGWPQGRVVLLKGVDHGFVWFTNYLSQKAMDLELHPKASLTFWWPAPARQVRITGTVEKISESESEEYFLTRPRGSQAGAIASIQSSLIVDRLDLEKKYEDMMSLPESTLLQKPEYWGGFRLIPTYFEFWQGRESRLHDRLFYKHTNEKSWETGRLSP
jgi:pyridoxamine-phosphate oxidase